MKRYTQIIAAVLFATFFVATTDAQSDHRMARFMDSNTMGFARIDLTRLDANTVFQKINSIAGDNDRLRNQAKGISGFVDSVQTSLKEAGAAEAYAFFSLSDLASGFFFVIPADSEAISKVKSTAAKLLLFLPNYKAFEIEEGVLIGAPHVAKRLKDRFLPVRDDANSLLQMTNETIDLVVAPTPDQLKAIRESIGPPWPRVAGTVFTEGNLTGDLLADGMSNTRVSFNNTALKIKLLCEGSDEQANQKIAEKLTWSLSQLSEGEIPYWPRGQEYGELPNQLREAIAGIKVAQSGKQFSVTLEENQLTSLGEGWVTMVGERFGSTSESFRNTSARQLALAIHNYVSAFGHFPKNIVAEDGTPLLSWRVAILPFVEQIELYEKFKRDEPWDSKHNKPLLRQMPDFLKTEAALADEGKTSWSLPTGEGFFSSCNSFEDIRDGSSNTIMIIETTEDAAVFWSAPDDLEPNLENLKAGIFSDNKSRSRVAWADGSTGVITEKISIENLERLLKVNDGEIVDRDDF